MKLRSILALASGAVFTSIATSAFAGSVAIGISLPAPVLAVPVAPAVPVYAVAPPPVLAVPVAPAVPVYAVAPPPVMVATPPVVVAPLAVPAPVYVAGGAATVAVHARYWGPR